MYGVHRVGVGLKIGLAIVLATAADGPAARAQEAGGAGGSAGRSDGLASVMRSMGTGPQTPVTILMAPAVQKELKLSEAQKTKVYNLSVAATQKQRDQFQTMFLGGGANPQAMLATRNAMRRDNERAIDEVLDSKQKERFDQIVLQAEGPLAVARPEIASKLNMNRNQQEYVQTVVAQLQQSQFMMYMRLRQGAATGQVGPGQLAQVRGMMEKLRGEAVQELGKIIDRKQKTAFNKLLGPPFDLAKLDAEAAPESAAAKPDDPASKEKDKDSTKETETEEAKAKSAAASSPGTAKPSSARRKTRSRSTSSGR